MSKSTLQSLEKSPLDRMKYGSHLLSSNQVFTQIKVTDLEKMPSQKMTIGYHSWVVVVKNSMTLYSSVQIKSTLVKSSI